MWYDLLHNPAQCHCAYLNYSQRAQLLCWAYKLCWTNDQTSDVSSDTIIFHSVWKQMNFFLFSWMQPLLDGVKILRLFAVIIYSFKVIIRPHQRNVRSSAPLLPSHQWVIITILLLLSSSLTGWPALKYILNRLQACTKWPIGSLLSVIEWRNSQQGGQWHLQTQSCLSSQTSCCIYEGNLLLFLHYNLPFVQFLTSCTKKSSLLSAQLTFCIGGREHDVVLLKFICKQVVR